VIIRAFPGARNEESLALNPTAVVNVSRFDNWPGTQVREVGLTDAAGSY
jgi:hypothetical protein